MYCSIQACAGSEVFGSRRSDLMHVAVAIAWVTACPTSQLQGKPLTSFVLVFPRGNADFAGSRLRIKEIGSQAPASETEAGEGLNVRRCGV